MYAKILAIEHYQPESVLDNVALAAISENWTPETILAKTGIAERRLAGPGEFTSDLAFRAAEKLFASGACERDEIDFLILCTQTPDRLMPTTACVVHQRLGLPAQTGALDVNLGCSGYVYCLSLVKGLIESGQASRVLLITADTYSKLLRPDDLSVRTLFGDASSATLIGADATPALGPFIHGTDGSGGPFLMTQGGGLLVDPADHSYSYPTLVMDGPSIFSFTLKAVPKLVHDLLEKGGRALEEVDQFVFHQANVYMLEHLRKKLGIPAERFVVSIRDCGNTVSSSIPLALQSAHQQGLLKQDALLMLVGFGVGLSWSGCLLNWRGLK